MAAALPEYLWFVVIGAFAAFGFGWGNGANDLANGFATSVGSKTLTMKQAVLIAIVFDFLGAMLLGRVVTNTIASGVADINSFSANPEVYAYGMICACIAGTIWIAVASKIGVNVSGTHFIVASIVSFGLIWDGSEAIIWREKDSSAAFPYKGVITIVVSWIFSPILTAACSAILFGVVRTLVLRRKNAYTLAFWTLPPIVFTTTFINMYFIFTKGIKKQLVTEKKQWTDDKSAWVAAVIAASAFVLTAVAIAPLLKRHCDKLFDSNGNFIAPPAPDVEAKGDDIDGDKVAPPLNQNNLQKWGSKAWKVATHGLNVDIHDVVKTSATVGAIHENAEVFEPRVEYAFMYLQVFSAICVIFAHGAGEVGYAAGPMSTIYHVWKDGKLTKGQVPPLWIIFFGAVALVVGLATYGYHTMRAMGVKLAKLTPTRGFAAELATALTVTVASQYGLPQSGSLCIVGAVVGIGIMEGRSGVNWKQFALQFCSWVGSVILVGLTTAVLFAIGIYTPSAVDAKALMSYKTEISAINANFYKELNTTLYNFREASSTNNLTQLSEAEWIRLNTTFAQAAAAVKAVSVPAKVGTVRPAVYLGNLRKGLAEIQNFTVLTLGQKNVFPGSLTCNSNITAEIGKVPAICKAPKLI
ncbi:uncharacterized protein [Physcomitrium patens]|uniref:Phosphate transporter n=1 Tax=Physcomitrium patens TaxID=3218 RepID=A0A2K1IPB6_PHYPA|nr:sodium-dependent phosphate transporter 1-like [Physcomitrium patens]PNR31122.1 hypothetical protein PHYPA_027439 [Physcomitrium patens]|eukprot:XP_024360721.1 sodium-dependent phosphate transporter 1-like [Physcomitrella patens]